MKPPVRVLVRTWGLRSPSGRKNGWILLLDFGVEVEEKVKCHPKFHVLCNNAVPILSALCTKGISHAKVVAFHYIALSFISHSSCWVGVEW